MLATARKRESISDLAERGIETLSLEVNDIESINSLYDEVSARTNGSLDFLVNNAGRNYTVPAMHVEIDEVSTFHYMSAPHSVLTDCSNRSVKHTRRIFSRS